MASKCLDLCQALVSQGQAFTLSLTHTGTSFTFSLDTRSKEKPSPMSRKVPSPSTRRRNARRKEEFLKMKTKPSPESREEPEAVEDSWSSELMDSDKSVVVKLKKKHSTKIPQVDGIVEELYIDAETQTEDIKSETKHNAAQTEDRKPETRQKSVQTNKTVLDLRFSEEKNCFSPPVQTNMGPFNSPSANMGPYRAPKTNMGPYPKTYRAPHSRDKL